MKMQMISNLSNLIARHTDKKRCHIAWKTDTETIKMVGRRANFGVLGSGGIQWLVARIRLYYHAPNITTFREKVSDNWI